jgi:hypothetical protein
LKLSTGKPLASKDVCWTKLGQQLKLRLKLSTGKPWAIKRCVLDQTGATTEVKIEAEYWKTFGNQKMCAGPNWGNN